MAMTVGKLLGGFLLIVSTSAIAATSSLIWDEDADGQLQLEDSALGTWCAAAKNKQKDAESNGLKGATVYERNQNCFFREPPDWIVLGPKRYRTMNRTCSMTNIARAEYPKNILVSYQCEQEPPPLSGKPEPKRGWIEQVEMGFLSSDHLYIMPHTNAPSR
jgi:hypothetical protein